MRNVYEIYEEWFYVASVQCTNTSSYSSLMEEVDTRKMNLEYKSARSHKTRLCIHIHGDY